MFGPIKRLFGIKPKDVDEVSFSVLNTWFETKVKEDSGIANDLTEVLTEIAKAIKFIGRDIDVVSKKAVEGVTHEQLQVVEDYKRNYLARTYSFLRAIEIPERRGLKDIINYNENLAVALAELERSTKQSSKAVQKFFKNYHEDINSLLDSIRDNQKILNQLVKEEHGIAFIYGIKKQMRDIEDKQKLLVELNAKVEREEIKQNDAENQILKFETNMDDLKTSPEFEKHDVLISKKLRLEKELERENENFKAIFAPISSSFLRYHGRLNASDASLAKQYADDPVNTLKNDKNLWLFTLIRNISAELPDLEHDENKRMRFRQATMNVNETLVKNFLSKHEIVVEALDQVHRQNRLNTTTIKMDDLRYKLAHVRGQIDICNENKTKLNEKISEINIEKDLLTLEKQLNTFSGVKII